MFLTVSLSLAYPVLEIGPSCLIKMSCTRKMNDLEPVLLPQSGKPSLLTLRAWNKPRRIGTRAWSPQKQSDSLCLQQQQRGGRRAVEKAGRWKARKTKSRFSSLPTALGNRAQPARFPLFPQPRLLLVSQTTSGNLIVVDREECLTPDTEGSLWSCDAMATPQRRRTASWRRGVRYRVMVAT